MHAQRARRANARPPVQSAPWHGTMISPANEAGNLAPEVLMDDYELYCEACNGEGAFNDAVVEVPFVDVVGIALEAGHIRGATARFPEPLALLECGAPTGVARTLGLVEGDELVPDAHIRVHRAYRALLETGRFTLLEKWGYTWIVPGDARKYVDQSALRAAVANVVDCTIRARVWEDLAA